MGGMELTSTNTEEVFEGRSAFVDNLGAIALDILAIGVVYQQYQISSRGGLTNYGIRHLQQDYYSSPSVFSRRRVRKQPKLPGYGLVSAASTAYNAITKYLPDVIEAFQGDDYEYDEYTLEEMYFNQLEEERLAKKRRKKKNRKKYYDSDDYDYDYY